MSTKRESGIALITALLVLFLMSALIVGMSWMVMTDQRLGGNNATRETAFYGAEAGMEKMTGDVATLFNEYGSLSAANIQTIVGEAPSLPGISYLNSQGQSTYSICYYDSATPPNKVCQGQGANPGSVAGTVQAPSPYAGLQALVTNYTMTVTADTAASGEVKLQRILQTSDIPVFQFGIFSNVDLGFHAGDDFTFGGRVHTNGNLWLAAGSGDWLDLPNKVTTAKEIVTNTIMNGLASSTSWSGAVNISNGSSYVNLDSQTPAQSISGSSWNIETLDAAENANTYSYNTGFSSLASGTYNGNIGVKETGVTPLNLSIVTSSLGGQAIDLIRMPIPGEDTSDPGKLGLRYYSEASVRILLSDYGPTGTCASSDISSTATNPLPYISPNISAPATTPVDLQTLAWTTTNPGGYLANVFPLPTSKAATGAAYSATSNGYWVQQNQPVITGCIKIDYQSPTTVDSFIDITPYILELGYTGPQIAYIKSSASYVAYPGEPALSNLSAATCTTPASANLGNSVIRLARVRDNPSNVATRATCISTLTQNGGDYWPNVLFDPREGMLRDGQVPSGSDPTLAGTMYYVELDIGNLSRCLTGAISTCSTAIPGGLNDSTGYTVYFSDRRSDRFDPTPPSSVPPTTGSSARTGAFGYDDFVNESNATSGCPNSTLDQGEDIESDYDQNGNSINGTLRTYDKIPTLYQYINSAGTLIAPPGWAMTSGLPLVNNSNCSGQSTTWPFAVVTNGNGDGQDLRQNPPMIFRRALKLVDGKTISLGTCNGVVCGLTVASENPVYVQGDYNNPGAPATCSSFTQCFPNADTAGGGIAASVAADSVTVLSNAWNDANSFISPYAIGGRTASTQTTYRMAVATGKPIGFPNPSGATADTGSDGGVHNFLRYIEDWGSSNIWYQGSFVALFYSHQAVGTFKCCSSNVYGIPNTRNMNFDTTFQTPADLPPRTPMLRNVNTIGFTQELMPTQ